METITQFIFEMRNPNIQGVLRHLIKNIRMNSRAFPAATKNHHRVYVGTGLSRCIDAGAEAKAISTLYPSLNKDLCMHGVILHDLGKVHELSGPVSDCLYSGRELVGALSPSW